MWVFSPRRNCSLSTLAEKKSTWMRSMTTAIANTRQIAIGYMPKPPPFQCCATVSKIGLILFPSSAEKSSKPTLEDGCRPPPAQPHPSHPGPREQSGCRSPNRQSGACSRSPPGSCRTAVAGTGPAAVVCAVLGFAVPMAREVTFPRTRHVALSGPEHAGEAKAAGSQAILVPIRVAEGATAPAGVLLPQPPEPGAPGVPEKGALPAAAQVPALAAGTGPAVPQQRELPWVVSVDIAEPAE